MNEIEEAITVAPGEGKTPLSIAGGWFCEKLVHPHLFPHLFPTYPLHSPSCKMYN